MYFDTHAHYDNEMFDDDRAALIQKLQDAQVSMVLNAACDRQSNHDIPLMCDQYDFMYGSTGFHPHDVQDMNEQDIDLLRHNAKHPKINAIGEIGLDYHYEHSDRPSQKKWFARQLELARELNLPVIIHDREAHADCLDILRAFGDVRCVFHCFSGSVESAKLLLERGCYLSFTGVITYKNAQKSRDVIRYMPLDRLMLETDCPYLAPEPHRGRRNDSRNLLYIAMQVADLKEKTFEQIAAITAQNGREFFNIP